jgi:protein involved in polysaccharide export with SLBB domain
MRSGIVALLVSLVALAGVATAQPTSTSSAEAGAAPAAASGNATEAGGSSAVVIRNAPGGNPKGRDGADGANTAPPDTPEGTAARRQAAAAQAAPQSRFQRFVTTATGREVEVFGSAYFNTTPGFAPVEQMPVATDYVIGPGDELYLRAWGTIDMDYRAVVDRSGQISIPRVGTVGVAGISAGAVEEHLRTQVARVFKGFSLNVSLGQLRSIQVFVVGQSRRPGTYTVSSQSTLINAVFNSGGPRPNGSMRRVQLRRGAALVTELDLYSFVLRGDKSKDARLLPGDVIVYMPVGPQVAVVGATDSPAIYELASTGESLRDVLNHGGGNGATTNATNAHLERIDPGQPKAPRFVRSASLAEADRISLQDGDVVTLFAVSQKFANAVTLRGNVAAPLRYPFTAGMRVSDLIPERDALITADYHLRKSRLVQYMEPRAVGVDHIATDMRNIVDEPNWEYATVERLNADHVTLQLIPFNLAKAVVERDPAQDLVLQAGDVITIFARSDIRGPVSRNTRLVRLEGEIGAPGVYALRPSDTLRTVLQTAGGLTGEAYVYGTEFSRAATRKAQAVALDDAVRRMEVQLAGQAAQSTANVTTSDSNLAALQASAQRELLRAQLARLKTTKPNGRIALELSTTASSLADLPDIPMEDGDTITVPSRPAFINVVGAVANENAILWRPGRAVGGYLKLAGVLPDADEENIFVINADGTVVHTSSAGRFGNIANVELMPGATVVLPERINRETFWTQFVRGLKDWTQILYQFGISAAAFKTLR